MNRENSENTKDTSQPEMCQQSSRAKRVWGRFKSKDWKMNWRKNMLVYYNG